jgi:hypothetical protein
MKICAVILSIALALAAASRGSMQGTAGELAFAPQSSTAAVGASVVVDITVANIPASPGLGGYDVTILFNSSVVRMDSFTDAGLLTGGSNIVICTPAQIDNGAGKATIACTPVPLFTSPGFATASPVAMLHASFTALVAGTSPLELTGSTLQDPSNTAIAATLDSGSITVTAVTEATATPSTRTTPQASATAAPSQTPAVTSSQAAATSTPTPQPVGTVGARALQPPATGTGGGSSGFPWPFAAAGVAGVVLMAAVGVLARSWRRRRA